MATTRETIRFFLEKLGHEPRFSARAMFGEYALYADNKTVALVCDNLLYVKICRASEPLGKICETDAPYPGAKDHYVIDDESVSRITELPEILLAISASLPAKKKRLKNTSKTKPFSGLRS